MGFEMVAGGVVFGGLEASPELLSSDEDYSDG